MKKILFMAVSALLLAAGCQKTTILNPVGEPTMDFSANMGKLTKATDASNGVANLQEQEFSVWAFAAYTDPVNRVNAGDPHSGMSPVEVLYDETKELWYTENEYYWPGTGKHLNFFALSTSTEATVDFENEGSAVDVHNRAMTIEGYAVDPTNPSDDLMVADFVCQSQDTDKNVALKFRHALSKVEFLFVTRQDAEPEDEDYRTVQVLSVSVEGLNTTSTLTVEETVGADDAIAHTYTWGDRTAPATFTSTDDAFTLTNEPQTFASWLVLPQQIGTYDGGTLEKNLQVKINYKMGVNVPQDVYFELSTADLKDWQPNQYIKYTVNITPNLIKFLPEVEPWEVTTPAEGQN